MPQLKLAKLNKKPILALTIGDPAGIGPEIVIKTLAKKEVYQICQPLVIGTKSVLDFYLKKYPSIRQGGEESNHPSVISTRKFELINIGEIKKLNLGKIDAEYGHLAYKYIKKAVELAKNGQVDGLVTAPISKEALNRAGLNFSGHTEILSKLTGVKNLLMLMVNKKLKVAMVTRHLPLKDVSENLTKEKIFLAIELAQQALKKYFSLPQPRIAVCALNPHSGEGGILGKEEKEIIIPAIKQVTLARRSRSVAKALERRRLGEGGSYRLQVTGPLPADTIFQHWQKYDLIIAMYHDQAMIPLKLLDPYSLVNVTLGLPFIRTSPGHGTAFDIAGKNIADERPMFSAVKLAVEMWRKAKSLI